MVVQVFISMLHLSQDVGRCNIRTDGLCPTLGTGCHQVYASPNATNLTADEGLLLQGTASLMSRTPAGISWQECNQCPSPCTSRLWIS